MSEAMKPTPGPWEVKRYMGDEWFFGHTGEFNVEAPGGKTIAVMGCEGSTGDDFRLIAEAGTVFHETGLSPRQILEQRGELLAVLQETGETLQRYCCGDNRALRTVREMRGEIEQTEPSP